MKLRKWAIPALLLLTVLSGCKSGGNDLTPEPTPEPTAEDAIGAYLKDWQRLDYAGMYAMLTPDARAKLTAEQFAERYGKIYEGIKADKLAVEDAPPPASPSSASPASTASAGPVVQKFQFSVSMDTIAGPVKFKHEGTARKTPDGEEQKWRIDWDSSMIFPR